MKTGRSRLKKHRAFLFFIIALLAASCATAPKVSFSPEQENRELSILPSGARIYLWVDAEKGRPLLDSLSSLYLNGERIPEILDRTQSAAAAIFPDQSGERRFFLAASGSYPRSAASFSFAFSKVWKRLKSVTGSSYWHSEKDNISLALGSKLALVSNTDPYEKFSPEIMPDGFPLFSRGREFAGWINDPSDFLDNFLLSLGIPLHVPAEDFFFGAVNVGSGGNTAAGWELVFNIATSSPAQARSLVTLFSMARLFITRGPPPEFEEGAASISPQEAAMLLFANAPELDGNALILRTNPLDGDRIALLFSLFSVYSN